MPTLRDVVGAVRHRLTGAGAITDQVTELAATLNATATTVPVVDATGLGPGVYEIGLEKIRVRTVDAPGTRLILWTFGRGYGQTKAQTYPPGTEITAQPQWAASTVAAEVNGVLRELYPALYGVRTQEETYTSPIRLPVDATGVVAAFIRDEHGGAWKRTDRWRYEPGADQGLVLPEARHGDLVRVQYAAAPKVFDLTNPAVLDQDYATVTGLPDRTADLMTLGVAYRLAPMIDLARLSQRGAEAKADQRDQNGGQGLSRLLLAEFQNRLGQEQLALHRDFPIRLHNER